jgi:serine protease Do
MKEQKIRNAPRAVLAVGALTAAVAGGYVLRGGPLTAQGDAPNAAGKTPTVTTPATTEAASMQAAFNQVSRAIEPAVVTITTERPRTSPTSGGRGSSPFGGGGPGGEFDPFGGGGASPFGGDLDEFFRRFRERGNGGGGGPELQPNSAEREQLRGLWREMQSRRGGGLGSGMIYRADGYIITNAHVVQGADSVTVKMNDGREFKRAKVIGADERTDIAVVKIEGTSLPIVNLGDSGRVNVGDWAIAVGNPFGLEHTVTVGVISAKAREVPLSERGPGDYLQTDASINPGNSGGPLCDIFGRVIGVNNAIYSQSGGNVGIGFAIPINTAKSIADRLMTSGRIVRGYLGVSIGSVEDAQTAAGLGLDSTVRGVLVNEVTDANGPAAKAGIRAGDVITAFNGKPVGRSIELQRLVGDAAVNSVATLTVLREGRTQTLRATLSELKDEVAPTRTTPQPEREEEAAPGPLGLKLRSMAGLTAQQLRSFGLKEGTRGVLVTGTQDNSPSANAGLRRGDVIERVGQTSVTTQAELKTAVDRLLARQTGADKSVGLYVNRAGQKSFFFVTVE